MKWRGPCARRNRARCRRKSPASPSTAARLAKGEAFFAIQGDNRDGHDFVDAALKAGAGLAVVARSQACALCRRRAAARRRRRARRPCAISRAPRARALRAKVIAVTGSVGKTGTKEALRLALSADGETHASAASYNNHWGVPLSLARCPADGEIRRVRDRHEPCRRDHAADADWSRPHVAIVTTIEPVHLEYFGSLEKIADAKAEIFARRRAGRRRRAQPRQRAIRAAGAPPPRRPASPASSPSASTRRPRRGLCVMRCKPDSSTVEADILGQHVDLQTRRARPAPRAEFARRAGGRVARRRRSRARRAGARQAASRATGRGARIALGVPGGSALLIDESYNANPASMRGGDRAARPGAGRRRRAAASPCSATCWNSATQGAALASRNWPSRSTRPGRRSGVLRRPADARALGGSSLRRAGAAMPRRRRRWSRPCSRPSAPATR